jgi:hypothetical protein
MYNIEMLVSIRLTVLLLRLVSSTVVLLISHPTSKGSDPRLANQVLANSYVIPGFNVSYRPSNSLSRAATI